MAAKVIQPTDPIEVKQLCCLIYGQPGSRKTSLAQTADNPITLAFDQGIYRAFGRKAAVQFDSWADVLDFDTSDYQTPIVDTLGMCLEKLSAAIIADNPKHGNRLGGLSLQGYGVLKTQFAAWVNGIKQRGQSIVFIAHEKVEKNGDEPYYCPDIVGGSYNTIMNVADMVGYLHFESGKRVIDFSPTDRWMAKVPPCGWKQIVLPDFGKEPHFLAKLLAEAKASMGQISAQSAEIAKEVDEWSHNLQCVDSAEELNKLMPEAAKLKNGIKRQVWTLMEQRAKAQGWTFDTEAKQFRGAA